MLFVLKIGVGVTLYFYRVNKHTKLQAGSTWTNANMQNLTTLGFLKMLLQSPDSINVQKAYL